MENLLDRPEYSEIIDSVPNIILMGFGGSYAYGTNIEGSDIDVRGIYMNPASELIGVKSDSEKFVDSNTDTVLYSFRKMLGLLTKCNPNTIEILGLRKKDYLMMTYAGSLLLENRHLFLSQRAVYSFGQYALSQLNRLENKSGKAKEHIIENEKRSYEKAFKGFATRHEDFLEKGKASIEEKDEQLYLNLQFKDMPIHCVASILNEINEIDRNYRKSSRNEKAIAYQKLSKHQMHLMRLFIMGIDILEQGEIITYREKEHDLLMAIRNGHFLESDNSTPTREFYALKNEYQDRFYKAAANTKLPKEPDYHAIDELAIQINKMYL